ncbi:MAG: dihydrofolate reductase family protein, partial [Nocardioidaceae bacterium]
FDTVVMGRGTYEPALTTGVAIPYPHLAQSVVSGTLSNPDPNVHVVTDPVAVVRELKLGDGLGVWLAGGGRLAAALREEIDELVIKRNPIVIGSGISLFEGSHRPTTFTPSGSRGCRCRAGLTVAGRQSNGRRSRMRTPTTRRSRTPCWSSCSQTPRRALGRPRRAPAALELRTPATSSSRCPRARGTPTSATGEQSARRGSGGTPAQTCPPHAARRCWPRAAAEWRSDPIRRGPALGW